MFSIPFMEDLERYLNFLGNASKHPQIEYYLLKSILTEYQPTKLGIRLPASEHSEVIEKISILTKACQGYASRGHRVMSKPQNGFRHQLSVTSQSIARRLQGQRPVSDLELGLIAIDKPDLVGREQARAIVKRRLKELEGLLGKGLSEQQIVEEVSPDVLAYVVEAILYDCGEQTSDHKVGLTLPEMVGLIIGAVSSITFAAYTYLWTFERLESACGEECATSWWATILELAFSVLSYAFIASLICRFNAERLDDLFRTSVFKAKKDALSWVVWGGAAAVAGLTIFNSPYLATKIFTSEEDPVALQVFRHVMQVFAGVSPFLGNANVMNLIFRDSALGASLARKARTQGKLDYVLFGEEMIARLKHAEQILHAKQVDETHQIANKMIRVHPEMKDNQVAMANLIELFRLSLEHDDEFQRQMQAGLTNAALPWYQRLLQGFMQSSGKEKLQKGLVILVYALSYYGFATNIEQGLNIPEKLFKIPEDSPFVNMGYVLGVCSWLINGGIGGMAWSYLLDRAFENGIAISKTIVIIGLCAMVNAIPGFEIAAKDPPNGLPPFSWLPEIFVSLVPYFYWCAAAGSAAYSFDTAKKFRDMKEIDFAKIDERYDILSEPEREHLKPNYDLKVKRMIAKLVGHFHKIEPDALAFIYYRLLYLLKKEQEAEVVRPGTLMALRGWHAVPQARDVELPVQWSELSSSDDDNSDDGLLAPRAVQPAEGRRRDGAEMMSSPSSDAFTDLIREAGVHENPAGALPPERPGSVSLLPPEGTGADLELPDTDLTSLAAHT